MFASVPLSSSGETLSCIFSQNFVSFHASMKLLPTEEEEDNLFKDNLAAAGGSRRRGEEVQQVRTKERREALRIRAT